MKRVTRLAGLAMLGLALTVSAGMSQDGKEKDKDKEKIKHAIPTGWGKLKLSVDQKQRMYAVQDEYQPKIIELKKKLLEVETQERGALAKILTAEQRAILVGEEKKSDEKNDK